jgi:hypothetical protein
MENPAASAREKPQRELKYLSQKIRLPASAAETDCDAAAETSSGKRLVLSIVALQGSRN